METCSTVKVTEDETVWYVEEDVYKGCVWWWCCCEGPLFGSAYKQAKLICVVEVNTEVLKARDASLKEGAGLLPQ